MDGTLRGRPAPFHASRTCHRRFAAYRSFAERPGVRPARDSLLLLADAKHGFSNPQADVNAEKYDIDLGYQQSADEKSWDAMQALFKEVF